ncbi:endonuclease/exonuclease/phosphatase family protein [Allostreptomyces psammosilenae]|uniref:Endonuclease/exonuclease/phosphatase family metal-dependent hydrolase n=1 Tax=Allostreptomyces psammosilenae TaxID=1892865 RepID=A0A852ZMP1_9ACTN|nr:endonuclease/exonuclease/phosphatase family protein [Allostreptomyces psammosilenae]NYI03669.1 endonuclease/exonuclease/phosphatase family metal-dependent hydrolase [Allostreptomyces psammosilenae]
MSGTPFSRRTGIRLATAAALTLPAAGLAGTARAAEAPSEDDTALRVMSFNLRYAAQTSPNSWADRRPVMRELLRRELPELLGTQEGLYAQLRDIAADLPPYYDWLGTGREGGSRGEFMAVYYDTRRLTPLEYDHFWLSDDPYRIGSRSWGNTVVRMVTWIRFHDSRTGRELYLLNTHLDHQSQNSRERSASLVTERLAALRAGVPRVVTGDFNARAHANPVYDIMLRGGLVDTWETAATRGQVYATFHGYQPLRPVDERIDWILTSDEVRTRRADINTFSRHGQFPSDHLPVQAVLEL